MRALALSLAALLAAPTLGRAQGRAVAAPPPRPTDASPRPVPSGGVRLESRPMLLARPGGVASQPGFGSPAGTSPRTGYERPHPAPVGDWHNRRTTDFGGHRRTRPLVVVVPGYGGYGSPYGSYYSPYGTYYSGAYGGAYTGTYLGTDAGTYGSSYTTPYTRAVPLDDEDTTSLVQDEPAGATRVLDVTSATPAAASLAVERLAGSLIRLRWTGREAGVREVALVVADASRRVLASQTVRAAPFSAVFENAGRVAFVGTTVVRADGVSTMTLVPLGRAPTSAKPRAALPPLRRTPE